MDVVSSLTIFLSSRVCFIISHQAARHVIQNSFNNSITVKNVLCMGSTHVSVVLLGHSYAGRVRACLFMDCSDFSHHVINCHHVFSAILCACSLLSLRV